MKRKKGFYEKYVKCPQDVILALIALIVLFPILLILTIINTIALKGNPFFLQPRPGKKGKDGKEKIFKLIKFRTMSNAKDKDGNLLPDEERLGKFGKLLRSTSLDELPSLINILCLDISIVGPRPLLVSYLSRYNEHQSRRHEVRPGFTGYAQVNGRNAITWEEKFDYDVYYVDNITFLGDWKIIFKTIGTVLKREGVSSNTSVTMEEFMGTKNDEEVTGDE